MPGFASQKGGFGGGGAGGIRPEDLEPLLPRDGSRPMVGDLELDRDPSQPEHAATKRYVDAQFSRDLHFIGVFNAPANTARYAPGSGYGGISLLPPSVVNPGEYLIIEVGGTVPPAGPVGGQTFNQGDWLISDGIIWNRLALGGPPTLARQVTVDPPVHGANNAQDALAVTTNRRGDTIEGEFIWATDGQGITLQSGARVYKRAGGGLVLRCAGGNDQPEIENNAGANSRPILDPQNLWTAGFLNGQTALPVIDLNTIQPPGYRCGIYNLANGAAYTNLPPGLPTTGTEANRWLHLYAHNPSSSADVMQVLYDICRPGSRVWARYKVDGAVNWSAWAPLINVDDKVAKAGDTMTGLLLLSGPPTANNHAATKAYVDAGDTAANANANNRVLKAGDAMTGGLSFGSVAQTDPRDISRHLALWGAGVAGFGINITGGHINIIAAANASNLIGFFAGTKNTPTAEVSNTGIHLLVAPTADNHAVSKAYADARVVRAGDTMTGLLTLSGPPTANNHAATKAYVDTADTLRVLKAGDTMTGELVLKRAGEGGLTLRPGSAGQTGDIHFVRGSDSARVGWIGYGGWAPQPNRLNIVAENGFFWRFNEPAFGVTPTDANHLATKSYVDAHAVIPAPGAWETHTLTGAFNATPYSRTRLIMGGAFCQFELKSAFIQWANGASRQILLNLLPVAKRPARRIYHTCFVNPGARVLWVWIDTDGSCWGINNTGSDIPAAGTDLDFVWVYPVLPN